MTKKYYCPRKGCPHHISPPEDNSWYRTLGTYETKLLGTQQRYQCKRCRKTFSPRTFSIDYYTKKKISYKAILNQQISASGINDMARQMKCSTETIQNRIRRLSHQVQGAMALYLHDHRISENLTADGLESFVDSQFFPTNINILVGAKSQFIYFFDAYFFKRKGKMTQEQKEKSVELYKEYPLERGMATKAFSELLDHLDQIWDRKKRKKLILDTDENPIYRGALKRKKSLQVDLAKKKLNHRLTNSKEERNRENKLFSCNYSDRMVRKDLAEHVRETVQFARDQNCSMERFSLYRFWMGFHKPFRINPRKKKRYDYHCEAAGISKEVRKHILSRVWRGNRVTLEEVSDKLSPFEKRLWTNRLITPTGNNERVLPKFMCA